MTIFQSANDYNINQQSVVTIGTFDGVHFGHKKIIEKLIQNAKILDCQSVILTFFPHPRMVLNAQSDIKLLNTINEKSVELQNLGLQNLVIQPFDTTFSNLTAQQFVKNILVDKLNIKKIIIGHDHRFGKNRSANIDDLILFGKQYNFEVEQISEQQINEVAISSTKIRTALLNGEVHSANQYLGYKYSFTGTVICGKQLGRTLGFPTANISVSEKYKLIPKDGVYIVQSKINNNNVFGIMNIGFKPTLTEKQHSIEIHFLDLNLDLYNKILTINILDHLRNEQKFSSLEELKNQIEKDKSQAIGYINDLKK